jgi:hypothetical protein
VTLTSILFSKWGSSSIRKGAISHNLVPASHRWGQIYQDGVSIIDEFKEYKQKKI